MAKIRHIAIKVEDQEKAATFYKETFGMTKPGAGLSGVLGAGGPSFPPAPPNWGGAGARGGRGGGPLCRLLEEKEESL